MKFVWETPEEINMALAQRLSRIRKRRNLSQLALSEKSNVSYGSIKRFETTGQISLISFMRDLYVQIPGGYSDMTAPFSMILRISPAFSAG